MPDAPACAPSSFSQRFTALKKICSELAYFEEIVYFTIPAKGNGSVAGGCDVSAWLRVMILCV
jgi:hypothetical protein